jgi:uncharacterized membrane protein
MTERPSEKNDVTHRTLRIVQFVNVLLFALVMGVFWGTWFSLSRSIASIRPETFLEVGHMMIANLGGPMSVLMPAALVSSVLLMIALFRYRAGAAFGLALVGFVLMIGALAVTLAVNVPIDEEINRWTADALPPDWMTTRDRWQLFHTIRTFVSIAAFGCAVASVMRWTSPSIGGWSRWRP